MSGISIIVDVDGLLPGEMLARLSERADDTLQLMTDIGAVLENSTRERITDTKIAPDGTAWAPNRAGTSTLFETGRHLNDSVASIPSANEVQVGAAWEYAHVHQDGAVIKPKDAARLRFMVGNQAIFARQVTIPARPFVGVSAEDETEVERIALDWLSGLISGLPGGRQ